MRTILVLLLCSTAASELAAQTPAWEYIVTINGNLFLPRDSEKQIYPILGYNSDSDPELLIGGMGIGMSAFRDISEKMAFKAQVNLSRHAYWDEPFELRGTQNEPLGESIFGSSDLALGLTATVNYMFAPAFYVGTGIGAQVATATYSHIPEFEGGQLVSGGTAVNRFYRPFLPVIPVEIARKGDKMLYSIRYEHGLSNRLKKSLAEYDTERFSLLYFEVGLRIR